MTARARRPRQEICGVERECGVDPVAGVVARSGVLVVRGCACAVCEAGETCEAAIVERYPGADPTNPTCLALIRAAHPDCELVY